MRAYAPASIAVVLSALLAALPAGAGAAWETIHEDADRKVEIDTASIHANTDGSVLAAGRLTYSASMADRRGFATLVAFNRYDCAARTFTIVKRGYFAADGAPADVEPVSTHGVMPSTEGSVDERLRAVACARVSDRSQDVHRVADDHPQQAPLVSIAPKLNDPKLLEKPSDTPPGEAKPAETRKPEARAAEGKPAAKAADTKTVDPVEQIANKVAEKLAKYRAAETARSGNKLVLAHAAPAHGAEPAAPSVKASAAAHAAAAEHAHWEYGGLAGPAQWGKLDPAWDTCTTGLRQSPIDIRDGIRVDLEPIVFDYRPGTWTVIDNGHTVQVSVAPGNTIRVGGRQYELVQMHFHRPSEERVEGKAFDMVAHLVHKSSDGKLAVIAVLIEQGDAHPLFNTLWAYLPLERNDTVTPGVPLDPAQILPEKRDYWTYMGSLTTPPCTEGVLWLVMKTPVHLSAEQIGIFTRLYPMNARPIQSASGRLIKESR